ncbi:MAG TPA: transcriptional regulator [Clostridia bacterium]|nr:transcriptional regulator [Clostridia bacterium]
MISLAKVRELLQARVLWGEEFLQQEVGMAFGCDLLSDMLAYAPEGVLILTGLTNEHLINTADIIGARAIVYVRGKVPDQTVIDLARQRQIPLMSTKMFLFESCGVLYAHGLTGLVDPTCAGG